MNKIKFIDIFVETHVPDDTYYTTYTNHMFYTEKDYTKLELSRIIESIKHRHYEDHDLRVVEIDLPDLINKLSEFGIFKIITENRYYFDIQEE